MGRPAEAEPNLRIGSGNIQREGPQGTADRQEEDDATQHCQPSF